MRKERLYICLSTNGYIVRVSNAFENKRVNKIINVKRSKMEDGRMK